MSSTENYWDDVPDDELEETLVERLEGLKEMFPESLRNGVSSTVDWGCWATQNFVSECGRKNQHSSVCWAL